jgi:hypothetical protein
MQISNDPNVWIIYGLVFLLGLLVGLFLTAGGRKKWKTRYYDEVDRHKATERGHAETLKERDRELKAERDRARAAAAAAPVAATTAAPVAKKAGIMDKMLGRDRDHDGIDDRTEGRVDQRLADRDGDGVPDSSDVAPDDSSKA